MTNTMSFPHPTPPSRLFGLSQQDGNHKHHQLHCRLGSKFHPDSKGKQGVPSNRGLTDDPWPPRNEGLHIVHGRTDRHQQKPGIYYCLLSRYGVSLYPKGFFSFQPQKCGIVNTIVRTLINQKLFQPIWSGAIWFSRQNTGIKWKCQKFTWSIAIPTLLTNFIVGKHNNRIAISEWEI